MRRARSIVGGAVILASALLFVAADALWLRSYFAYDFLECSRHDAVGPLFVRDQLWQYASGRGRVALSHGSQAFLFHDEHEARQYRASGGYSYDGLWRLSRADAGVSYSAMLDPIDSVHFAGLGWWDRWNYDWDNPLPDGDWVLTLPWAVPVMLFAVLPTRWCARFLRRHRRVRSGHCVSCDYDLRASPGRCPECGATPLWPV